VKCPRNQALRAGQSAASFDKGGTLSHNCRVVANLVRRSINGAVAGGGGAIASSWSGR